MDIVYTYVDCNNINWFNKKQEYYKEYGNYLFNCIDCNNKYRFESRDELLYSLRSVEKYVHNYNNIYIVIDHEPPTWLNTIHPKIRLVPHTAINSLSQFVPVFNSNAIECHLHNINEISQRFLYLNDDIIFTKQIDLNEFNTHLIPFFFDNCYTKKGIPVNTDIGFRAAWKNTNSILDLMFQDEKRLKLSHGPMVIDRNIINEIWSIIPTQLTQTTLNKFRSITDINLTCGFYPYFSLYTNRGYNAHNYTSKTVYLNDNIEEGEVALSTSQENNWICIEDTAEYRRDEASKLIKKYFNNMFPEKSQFENNIFNFKS